jgi:hypothetical protein
MSIQKYEQAEELIKQTGGGDFEGPKPEALVAKAEEALGIAFPPSYRRFLLQMGCGDFNGLEIYGLINDNFDKSTVPNGIWLTRELRRTIGLNRSYVIVGDAGDGTYFALDTSRGGSICEVPVVQLSVDGKYEERVAESFGDYLLSAVGNVI